MLDPTPVPGDTLLCDLGNVLTDDPWERILLAPRVGLASRLDVEPAAVHAAGLRAWQRHHLAPSDESGWWADVEDGLQRDIETGLRAELLSLVRINLPLLEQVIAWHELGVRVGVVSDNTSFFFEMQHRLLHLSTWADPRLVFLSFDHGLDKHAVPGLLELARAHVEATTWLIDDRASHIARAEGLGFRTAHLRFVDVSDHD